MTRLWSAVCVCVCVCVCCKLGLSLLGVYILFFSSMSIRCLLILCKCHLEMSNLKINQMMKLRPVPFFIALDENILKKHPTASSLCFAVCDFTGLCSGGELLGP